MTEVARRILVVTTSRADFSHLLPVMRAVRAHPRLELAVAATGMHLAPGHQASLEAMGHAGFPPDFQVPSIDGDSAAAVAQAMGRGITGFANLYAAESFAAVVVLGDRFDMFPAVVAALPFRLPVAHLHGGELTFGAIDDSIRHAVSKMAHLHFVATEDFARRLRRMGEEDWRITVSGAPGLETLAAAPVLDDAVIATRTGLQAGAPFVLATLHPETLAGLNAVAQAEVLCQAAMDHPGWLLITAPNADTGANGLRQRLEQLTQERPQTILLENAGPELYPNLLRRAALVVGNSSSGIIEAGFFGRPVVNIGDRQAGRPMGGNVLCADWDADAVSRAWARALDPAFAATAATAIHPYGRGGASAVIAQRLAEMRLGPDLCIKRFNESLCEVP